MAMSLDAAAVREQIVGIDALFDTPYGKRLMFYADYTASGRTLHFVEDYLKQQQNYFANTHTDDDMTGRYMTHLVEDAEQKIKQAVNADHTSKVVCVGAGATGAIERMQQIVGVALSSVTRMHLQEMLQGALSEEHLQTVKAYCQQHQPVVFVGPYEHHSNEVSWRESLATVVEVNLTDDGEIDLGHLETLLNDERYKHRLRIGSFSAASNVTGMISPVYDLAVLLHKYDALAFIDYAASAPYVAIDMNPEPLEAGDNPSLDAIFVSPHKFVGGPGSSGLLVFNQRCYHDHLPPSMAGGGTVDYVGPEVHDFIHDIETREKAGTPGILQVLKTAMAFEVKKAVGQDAITQIEHRMLGRVFSRWVQHPRIEILGNQDPEKRIGIIAFNIKDISSRYLHPRYVTTLLNDLFGIQSRAGCSCAGPYGHRLLDIDEQKSLDYRAWVGKGFNGIKPGWCRVGVHYTMDDADIDYLIQAVEYIADYGALFLSDYHFDPMTGLWQHRESTPVKPSLNLEDALNRQPTAATALDTASRVRMYRRQLDQAQQIALQHVKMASAERIALDPTLSDVQFFALVEENCA